MARVLCVNFSTSFKIATSARARVCVGEYAVFKNLKWEITLYQHFSHANLNISALLVLSLHRQDPAELENMFVYYSSHFNAFFFVSGLPISCECFRMKGSGLLCVLAYTLNICVHEVLEKNSKC